MRGGWPTLHFKTTPNFVESNIMIDIHSTKHWSHHDLPIFKGSPRFGAIVQGFLNYRTFFLNNFSFAITIVHVFRNLERKRRDWTDALRTRVITLKNVYRNFSVSCCLLCLNCVKSFLCKQNPKVFSTITQSLIKFRSFLQKLLRKKVRLFRKPCT